MTDEHDPLTRIEGKLDRLIEQTASHTADIAWLKRIVGALGSIASAAAAYLWRKSS